MNILRLEIGQIDAANRLRPLDLDWVNVIAASMAESGQQQAIEVRTGGEDEEPWVLVAGGHRLAAASQLGWSEIDATEFSGTALQAELREIDENLIRHELKELDRATFLARRKAVYEELYPATKHGGKRVAGQVGDVANLTARFTAEAAERIGLSESGISRVIRRHDKLDAQVRRDIAVLWIADHGAQLDALGKLPHSEQRQVADALLTFPGLRSVAAARDHVNGVQAATTDPVAEQFDAFLRLWRRMPEAARRRVRTHVNKKEGVG